MPLPIVYHPDYVVDLPPNHRFPMPKFRLLFEHLQNLGLARHVHTPTPPPEDWLELVHRREYVQAYRQGSLDSKRLRRIGLPWSPALVHRTCIAVGGSVLTARLALQYGLACNTAGGTHHAFPDYGSGFCIFNDLAVIARLFLAEGLVQKVLIVDLDVHQGDGTAFIFAGDPDVFTFSMHCQANFPGTKQHSHLDVPLPVGLEDEAYLQTLSRYLPELLDQVKPDLVLYDAGVDPHQNDPLGKLNLTDSGLFRRDMQVLQACAKRGIPVAGVIGGGYGLDLQELAARHSCLHRAANEVFQEYLE
ncbi:MAG: histone deacetylase [Thermostichales cyanobacterium BF4_bins_65]